MTSTLSRPQWVNCNVLRIIDNYDKYGMNVVYRSAWYITFTQLCSILWPPVEWVTGIDNEISCFVFALSDHIFLSVIDYPFEWFPYLSHDWVVQVQHTGNMLYRKWYHKYREKVCVSKLCSYQQKSWFNICSVTQFHWITCYIIEWSLFPLWLYDNKVSL